MRVLEFRRFSSPVVFFCLLAVARAETAPRTLPGSAPLDLPSDWRETQRRQILSYLDRRLQAALPERDRIWKVQSRAAFFHIAARERRKLAGMTGYVSPRIAQLEKTANADKTDSLRVTSEGGISAFAEVHYPAGGIRAVSVVVPDAGNAGTAGPSSKRDEGTAVAILTTVPRDTRHPFCERYRGLDRRRILYRLAFVVGETLPGLEAQQASLIRMALHKITGAPVSISGTGQGGMTALLAAALDPEFESAEVRGYFGSHPDPNAEPVDRMLSGQALRFGNAELAALVAPRALTLEDAAAQTGFAKEVERAKEYFGIAGSARKLNVKRPNLSSEEDLTSTGKAVDPNFESLYAHLRERIEKSEEERYRYWQTAFRGLNDIGKSGRIRSELQTWMGVPEEKSSSLTPRTRLLRTTRSYAAYEVMLGVLPGLDVYGHLLIPEGHKGSMPAVICQHGLDGQPKDITGAGPTPNAAYHEFGRRLAERGYVVFAPYLTVPSPQADLINPIVRKAAALGMLRTAIEVRKLSRVIDFLESLPQVDAKRIGYYGLSYGGYSAIWMGPLEPRLKTVIVSGHFNDWRSKISNDELRTSYMMHPDEDFFNFNVLHRFTHPELIAAMLPRAVMVEFADRDATTTPEWHGAAWKQAEALAAGLHARVRLDRDVFAGVHEIGGMRTLDWLDRWLKPQENSKREYSDLVRPGGRDLPGLADMAAAADSFDQIVLGSGEAARIDDQAQTGFAQDTFYGIALRVSRNDRPGNLLVRFGTGRGLDDLGSSIIQADSVHSLQDVWYEARIPGRKIKPGSTIYFRVENQDSARGSYAVYGPKPLGGKSYPSSFYLAYRILGKMPSRTPAR